MLMIEDTQGIANLADILKQVPGIGLVLIGEGDLSQELGFPRQYEHPQVLDAMAHIVKTCKEQQGRMSAIRMSTPPMSSASSAKATPS